MPKSYSLDLRVRVHAFVEAGHSRRAAARHFDVSPSFVINLMTNSARRGSLAAKPRGGAQHSKLQPFRAYLIEQVEAQPDITLEELAAGLKDAFDLTVHLASISRLLREAGFTYKKNTSGAGIRTR
jgi:transposase